MKIAIIGNAGSGKSTLGRLLHRELNIPLYHLDQYFWLPGWQEPNRDDFQKIHNQLCDQDQWIIEGMAVRFLEYRMQRADVVIFLDKPAYLCLFRVLKRAWQHFGKEHAASPKGCPERGPSLKFLKFIWCFNRDRKPVIEALIEQYRGEKRIFVVTDGRPESIVSTLMHKIDRP